MGYVGSTQRKFCTWVTCNINAHKTKHEQFLAGLYLKAGSNAVYCMPMLSADRIPLKQLAAWLEEKGTSVGIWQEQFTLCNAIHLEEKVDELEDKA
eukprot:4324271-Ditylum_brightwellii.AAC.1